MHLHVACDRERVGGVIFILFLVAWLVDRITISTYHRRKRAGYKYLPQLYLLNTLYTQYLPYLQ